MKVVMYMMPSISDLSEHVSLDVPLIFRGQSRGFYRKKMNEHTRYIFDNIAVNRWFAHNSKNDDKCVLVTDNLSCRMDQYSIAQVGVVKVNVNRNI